MALLPLYDGALKLRPCKNADGLKTRGEAELKVLPLKAGGLKVLVWITREGTKLLPGGRPTGAFEVPGFIFPGLCRLPIEVDGAALVVLAPAENGAEAIRLWLSPKIVRALD
jgi:hypothetical protein